MKRKRRRKKRSIRDVRDCKNCLYYNRKFKICTMGLNHCILNQDTTKEMKQPDLIGGPVFCWNCPYGKGRPCVSFCMRKILEEWQKERNAFRKEIRVYA